jgi:hypothetical protein
MSHGTKEDINDHNNDMTPPLSMSSNNGKDDDSPETSMTNLTSPSSSPSPLTSLCNTPTELSNCSSKNKKFKSIRGRIKEMISILGTLQLGPILITMLYNLLGVNNKKIIDRKEQREKETIKTDDKKSSTGAGSGEAELGANLLTASVYGLTGRIMETLNELGLTDPSLLQSLVQIPQGKESPLVSVKGTFINLMTSKERIIPLSSLNKITNTDYFLVVGQCCSTMLESLMALMETPATSSLPNSNDTPIQLPNSANNASIIQQSTSYKLSPSPCDDGCSSSRINDDNNDNTSNIDNIQMMVSFHPIDADDSVRHLLSFLGLICTIYLGLDSNLHTPTSSTITNLIKMLIKLPPRYYSEERFMKQLFPTLIALCKGREEYLHKDVCMKLQKFKDSLYSAH